MISGQVVLLGGRDLEVVYDSAGRLSQIKKGASVRNNYIYDLNSNRTSGLDGNLAVTAIYDDQDRLTAYNTYDFGYNANGEMTSKTNSLTSVSSTYSYDSLGRLKQVNTPTKAISYEIDGLGRRASRSVNGVVIERYIYMDTIRIAATLDAGGNLLKRFIYASKYNVPDYMTIGSESFRIISDNLGSVRLVVRLSDGQVVQRIDYDVAGNVLLDSNTCFQPFGFAGGLRDPDTPLVRFGARDYDPEVGRWTTKDPILFEGSDTNLFGYVSNDPVNWIDPEGKFAVIVPAIPWIIEGATAIGEAVGICSMASKSKTSNTRTCQKAFESALKGCAQGTGSAFSKCFKQANEDYFKCVSASL